MSTDTSERTHGLETSTSPGAQAPKPNGGAKAPDDRTRGSASASRGPQRSRRAVREPPANAIQASRRARDARQAAVATEPAAEGAAAPSAPTAAGSKSVHRADSDPWTVPQSVRDRFVQEGHRFYFPDGAPAFRDLGRRLTTASENTQVVRSLIDIAHSRGWTEVTVTGTERFRQEAWRQARMSGLEVRGYRPSEVEQAQLIRALARNLARPADRVDAVSSEPTGAAPAVTQPAPSPADTPPVRAETGTRPPEPGARNTATERYVGRLLDHGKDTYRHEPDAEPSYFVRLGVPGGYREIWGKDLEPALHQSLTQAQIGDEVVLQIARREPVTVKRRERGAQGEFRNQEVAVYRNRWVIEKREFFEQRAAAAQVVRDESVRPQEAVREHPELAGTYLNLRAAELAAQRLRDPEDQRRFVAQVRVALAEGIERGEPLQPVRLRERAPSRAPPPREPLSRS